MVCDDHFFNLIAVESNHSFICEFFFAARFELENFVLEGGTPFDKVYGGNTYEYPPLNARFNEVFSKAIVHHSHIVIKEILKGYHGFNKLKHVLDVDGGFGITLNMIVSKHPLIKGIIVICHM
ncbi:hypothetical protein R6Q59_022385 [Mikania micrantha]